MFGGIETKTNSSSPGYIKVECLHLAHEISAFMTAPLATKQRPSDLLE